MANKLPLQLRATVFKLICDTDTSLDSIQIKRAVELPYVPGYDWHEYSSFLEDLKCRGLVMQDGVSNDGHAKYIVANF